MSNALHGVGRKVRSARNLYLTDMRGGADIDMNKNVDLLGREIRRALRGDTRLVVPVFLHQLPNVLQCAVQFVLGITFPLLEFRSVDDLVRAGPVWRSFDFDCSHKIVGRCHERQYDTGA